MALMLTEQSPRKVASALTFRPRTRDLSLAALLFVGILLGAALLAVAGRQGGEEASVPLSSTSAGGEVAGLAASAAKARVLEMYASGELEEATPALGGYWAEHPDDPEVGRYYAEALWRSGSSEAALKVYRDLLESAQTAPEVAYEYALVLRSRGEHDEALRQLERAVEGGGDFDYRMEAARTLRMAGRHREAAEAWKALGEELPAGDPRLAGLYYELGLAALESADSGGAFDAFEQGLKVDPENQALREQLELLSSSETTPEAAGS